MNKAVIYISGTMNETVDNMVVRVIERYCEKHGYEIAALLGESSQSGMSMPMKYSFIGMAEVEDIDTVVTLSSAMVGTTDDEIMETIDLLAHYACLCQTIHKLRGGYSGCGFIRQNRLRVQHRSVSGKYLDKGVTGKRRYENTDDCTDRGGDY